MRVMLMVITMVGASSRFRTFLSACARLSVGTHSRSSLFSSLSCIMPLVQTATNTKAIKIVTKGLLAMKRPRT